MTPCACCRADCYPDEFRAEGFRTAADAYRQFGWTATNHGCAKICVMSPYRQGDTP